MMSTLASPRTLSDSPATCVPDPLDAAQWSTIEPIVHDLLNRPIASRAELEQWLLDYSELQAACSQTRADLYIATTADTLDESVSNRFNAFVQDIAPKFEQAVFDLDRRLVELADRFPLEPNRYQTLLRNKKADVELFRTENVPINVELNQLAQDYSKIVGSQTVTFDGKELTLIQMATHLQSTDRALRERAWHLIAQRRLADRASLDDILDRMISRRHTVARNAACENFVHYAFKEKHRFDYTPQDCRTFWNAVERRVVPVLRRLNERRRCALGLQTLRPWDLAVDPKGRDGLKPFAHGGELFSRSVNAINALDPRLGSFLDELGSGAPATIHPDRGFVSDCLDLDSRKGKRPGGYMYVRDRSRKPFIFMNAAGMQRDVVTMVHEAGHAFHSMLCASEPLSEYRHSPTEFAEVASMSMELLSMPYWGRSDSFYPNPVDHRRAMADQLEQSLIVLTWIASIDAFQHWMYEHPDHTHTQRDDFWIELDQRFGNAVDWAGLEDTRRSWWQRQAHPFTYPMYYIEYGIAQLGAFQLWLKAQSLSEKVAVDAYIRALTLGGSKPLPDLFKAADINFDFSEPLIARIAEKVESELSRLDA